MWDAPCAIRARTCRCCAVGVPRPTTSNSCRASSLGWQQSIPSAMYGPTTTSSQNPRRSRLTPRSRPCTRHGTEWRGTGLRGKAVSDCRLAGLARMQACLSVGGHGPVGLRVRLVTELKGDARLAPVPVVHKVNDAGIGPNHRLQHVRASAVHCSLAGCQRRASACLVVPVEQILAKVVAGAVVVAQPLVAQCGR